MDLDLILACAHHLAVFALVVLLAMEFALLRPGLTPEALRRLGAIDIGFGLSAGIVLIVGFARVSLGATPSSYYFSNPVFWAKLNLFLVVGLLSIPPTLRILAWRRALASDPDFAPEAGEIGRLRKYLHAELFVLFLIPVAAAAMARGYGG